MKLMKFTIFPEPLKVAFVAFGVHKFRILQQLKVEHFDLS